MTVSGPSGSGKTLLLRAVADLDPHAGDVSLDGSAQSKLTGPEWRRRVAYLAAESHWWDERVGAHFQYSLEDSATVLGFPAGVADWKIRRLSSGEKQRLALLRALEREPEVLLLDEPTANLDAESQRSVEALVADYLSERNAMAIWVSHDAKQRRRVGQRHFEFQDGHLIEVTDVWN